MDPDQVVAWLAQAQTILTDPRNASDPDAHRRVVSLVQRALAAMPADFPVRDDALTMLGGALSTLFTLTGDRRLIDDSVDALSRASTSSDPYALMNLGDALKVRYDHFRELDDLDAAIQATRRALDCGQWSPVERAGVLSNYGTMMQTLFVAGSHEEHIAAAIAALREAVAVTPEGHPLRRRWLTNLGNAYTTRFLATGHRADLDEAIAGLRTAADPAGEDVQLVPAAERAGYLSNLGGPLGCRFAHTGNKADLDEAVATFRAAVELAGRAPDRAGHHSNLALTLTLRYRLFGGMEDIDEAVRQCQEALHAGPADHVERALHLAALGGALAARFERTRAAADIDDAVSAFRDALARTPPGHLDAAGWLANLGGAFMLRFTAYGDPADLQQSIGWSRGAIDAVTATGPWRGRYLSNLAATLTYQAQRSGLLAHADEAITTAQAAVAAVPAGHPASAGYLRNLGNALTVRYTVTQHADDRHQAVHAYRESARVRSAPTLVRAGSARAAGELTAGTDWPATLDALAEATTLLARLAGRHIGRSSRQDHLARFNGMVCDAAAAAVHCGRPQQALGLLEQGRAVLLSQSLETQEDLDSVRDLDQELADRFVRLGTALDRDAAGPLIPLPGETRYELSADQRNRLADQWEQTIEEIRALPGHARFLRPPAVEDLLPAAADGYVVTVNVSRHRCDALILTPQGVELVALPGLTAAETTAWAVRLLAADGLAELDQLLPDLLGWLWDKVAGPVLDTVAEIRPAASGATPRVWWVPTGALTLLPLHAAGRSAVTGASVLDRVIGSYLPTIRSLQARQASDRRRQGAEVTPLVVAMQQTPGHPDLASAGREAQEVGGHLPAPCTHLSNEEATVAKVRQALATSTWVHLACHGVTDPVDPSDSHVLVYDGRLGVRDIVALRLPWAHLVYLSACTTASAGMVLPDESVHLSSAFLLAGYTHVIGTLWPVNDRVALRMARTTYQALAHRPPAYALHQATCEIRVRFHNHPSCWAAYLHVGP